MKKALFIIIPIALAITVSEVRLYFYKEASAEEQAIKEQKQKEFKNRDVILFDEDSSFHKDWTTSGFIEPVLLANFDDKSERKTHKLTAIECKTTGYGYYTDIDFYDDQFGIAVGGYKLISVTHDGGETWRHIRIQRDNSLFGVQIVTDKVAYAVGKSTIYKTVDAGLTWKGVHSTFSANDIRKYDEQYASLRHTTIRSVYFTDENNGVVVGHNLILHTEDGGKTWENIPIAYANHKYPITLWSVDFSDEENGIAVGSDNTIFTTGDGGKSWNFRKFEYDQTLTRVITESKNKHFVVGYDGFYANTDLNFKNSDGWPFISPSILKNRPMMRDITRVDDQRLLAVSNDSHVYLMVNDGKSWYDGITQNHTVGSGDDITAVDYQNGKIWYAGSEGQLGYFMWEEANL
ncbi:WD40/YVTN/BNR-like repeat-containing protein [Reichenbachiella versicolor]|uniref:WD40/YVTN/BNR-like repeat-containing protein n=1 Tax=Reichenbachiella versicolor TaxID=1821036 RepID=UPI0013A57265|nr:YCF48-related protein [Reichenbachiella versicolor]